jgi:hypothetical protein
VTGGGDELALRGVITLELDEAGIDQEAEAVERRSESRRERPATRGDGDGGDRRRRLLGEAEGIGKAVEGVIDRLKVPDIGAAIRSVIPPGLGGPVTIPGLERLVGLLGTGTGGVIRPSFGQAAVAGAVQGGAARTVQRGASVSAPVAGEVGARLIGRRLPPSEVGGLPRLPPPPRLALPPGPSAGAAARAAPAAASAAGVGLSVAAISGIVTAGAALAVAGVGIAAGKALTSGVDKRIARGLGTSAEFSGALATVGVAAQFADIQRALVRGDLLGGSLLGLQRQRSETQAASAVLGNVVGAELNELLTAALKVVNPALREIVAALLQTGKTLGLLDAERVNKAMEVLERQESRSAVIGGGSSASPPPRGPAPQILINPYAPPGLGTPQGPRGDR